MPETDEQNPLFHGGPVQGALPLRSGLRDADTPLVPARILNEFVYCPRLAYLEWAQKEWEKSPDTVEGKHVHRRVDKRGGALPEPEEEFEGMKPARSVELSSQTLNLIAKIDLVEGKGGEVRPVDYKRGTCSLAIRWLLPVLHAVECNRAARILYLPNRSRLYSACLASQGTQKAGFSPANCGGLIEANQSGDGVRCSGHTFPPRTGGGLEEKVLDVFFRQFQFRKLELPELREHFREFGMVAETAVAYVGDELQRWPAGALIPWRRLEAHWEIMQGAAEADSRPPKSRTQQGD